MKFKVRTLNQAVVIVSAISAVLDVVVAILHGTPWWAWIATGIATYLITFGTSRFFLRQYVVYRIKPLYQLLLSRDIATSRLSEELRRKVNDDVVDDIQENLDHLISFSSSEIERLRQKDADRTEFLASVFHEIRTPIFNVEGYAQTILDNGLEDSEINRKYLGRMLKSIERLTGLVEDIDKLSRYESGGSILYKEMFDIVELLNDIEDENLMLAGQRDITIRIVKAPFPARKPIMVYADRLRIGQALEELIRNAIFFGHKGGSVTVGFVDMFDKVLVEVSDDGVGIPAKDLPHIFEQFYRVEKSRSREQGGQGLGLTGVKRIVDNHGEYMTVRSEVGKGTTFSITLRRNKPPDE